MNEILNQKLIMRYSSINNYVDNPLAKEMTGNIFVYLPLFSLMYLSVLQKFRIGIGKRARNVILCKCFFINFSVVD